MKKVNLCFQYYLLISFFLFTNGFAQTIPLPMAFAHNDYEHSRPLLDALEKGFGAVEADLHLVNGELFLGHNSATSRLFKDYYLDEIRIHIQNNGGEVYKGYEKDFYIMTDFKSNGEESYLVLKSLLNNYRDILTHFVNGQKVQGKVFVFISGNRPVQAVLNDTLQLAGLDGRPEDLGKGYSSEIMPIISRSFTDNFDMLAKDAHEEGKLLRLWAMPDQDEAKWDDFLAKGLDFINSDFLDFTQNYFLQRIPANIIDRRIFIKNYHSNYSPFYKMNGQIITSDKMLLIYYYKLIQIK